MAFTLAVYRTPGFDGTFSGIVVGRGKTIGDLLIEDTQLRREKIGSIMGVIVVFHK